MKKSLVILMGLALLIALTSAAFAQYCEYGWCPAGYSDSYRGGCGSCVSYNNSCNTCNNGSYYGSYYGYGYGNGCNSNGCNTCSNNGYGRDCKSNACNLSLGSFTDMCNSGIVSGIAMSNCNCLEVSYCCNGKNKVAKIDTTCAGITMVPSNYAIRNGDFVTVHFNRVNGRMVATRIERLQNLSGTMVNGQMYTTTINPSTSTVSTQMNGTTISTPVSGTMSTYPVSSTSTTYPVSSTTNGTTLSTTTNGSSVSGTVSDTNSSMSK